MDLQNVDYDPQKHKIMFRTELGYNIIFDVEPHIAVNYSDPFLNGAPEFQANMILRPVSIQKGKTPMTKEEITNMMKDRNVINENLNYEHFTIGFVYANQTNPNNHKWMFEYRKQKQIFYAQHFLGVNLRQVPITTMSWFDGIYHGRFMVAKEAVEKVIEESPGYVSILGKDKKTNPVNDFSRLIPKDIEKVRLRFNIKEDYWYADLLKKDEVVPTIKPLKMRHITAEALDFDGVADFNFPKPKVYYLCKREDIADAKLMADTLFLIGKGVSEEK